MDVFSATTALYVGNTSCSAAYVGGVKVWPMAIDYTKEYLTFRITQSGNLIWTRKGSATKTISYSKDNGGTWINVTSTTGGTVISVSEGDVLQLKGNNTQYATSDSVYNTFSGSTCSFTIEGNIMSLIYEDNFTGQTTLTSNYTFSRMFIYCQGLTSIENLVMPATTLSQYCYNTMFLRCYNLSSLFETLPATTLAANCYRQMFRGCSSLKKGAALPATTLANSCYISMYEECSSLEEAPVLPATAMTASGYSYMFKACTSLVTPPALPATTLNNGCYFEMFRGCTSLTAAPDLTVYNVPREAYRAMFYDCSTLNYIRCLAGTFGSNATQQWVYRVSSSGTFIKKAGVSWSTGVNGIPNGWTVQEE